VAGQGTIERARGALAGIEHRWLEPRDAMPALALDRSELKAALRALKERAGFEMATFVSAVDRFPRTPRFELVHQLLSLAHDDRVRIHTALAEGESAPTCTDLWPGARFMERECWDMFGIPFEGHANLRRLLMPEQYGHHPLRKDFPHQGIEPDKLYRTWDKQRRKDWNAAT